MQGNPSVTLTNCDREPIHIPGSIQTHGCLIACDSDLITVKRHSANTRDFLHSGIHTLAGERAEKLLGATATHEIRNALTTSNDASRPALLFGLEINGHLYDVSAHRHKGAAIVEFERAKSPDAARPLEIARSLVSRLKRFTTVDEMLKQAPRLIKAMTEYDRVMIYRFAEDGSGQVIGEAKRHDLESFLGQHFPANDIPQQARELYVRNTIRVISNSACARIEIKPPLDASGEPLDLSYAHLRSVSPIHCEYLRNMGVAASMSVSVLVDGSLWGLVACHHYSPRALPMAQRVAAEMFGEYFSLQLEALTQRTKLEAVVSARRVLDGMLRDVTYHDDIDAYLRTNLTTFRNLLPCDGVGLWLGGKWNASGSVPPEAAVASLARHVTGTAQGRVWATHELAALIPAAADFKAAVSGVLAVPVSQVPRDYLFFFRKEVIETVAWAGDPNKQYESGVYGDRLTPRKSFAIWKETVERQSLPWTPSDREIAEATRTALLEVIMRQTEILAAERRKADVRQKLLNEELNHRVKNILALIKSVVSQPNIEQRSLIEYVNSLKGRIMALAFAHDQIVRSDGGGGLRNLLEAELGPYRNSGSQIVFDGPEVGLDARAYSVMALVLHEMVTNAAKYGALSTSRGSLEVAWQRVNGGDCEVRWTEKGGPPIEAPLRAGFGTTLVDRSVPFDLGGESELQFPTTGATARFLIPAKFVSVIDNQESRLNKPNGAADCATLAGLRVLVVEDQLIIAMDVESVLSSHGAEVIGTAATADEALRIINATAPDAAVLDVNLGSGTSIPVAEELSKRNIPFVFATGYGDATMIPRHLSAPIVRKPHDAGMLVASIAAVVRGANSGTD